MDEPSGFSIICIELEINLAGFHFLLLTRERILLLCALGSYPVTINSSSRYVSALS